MPNAAPGAATILDYSEMRRPSINNSCNKVIVIKLDKLYYSKPKLYYDKPKLFNNNMPTRTVPQRVKIDPDMSATRAGCS